MSLYKSVANAVGTRRALDLSHRLAVWHDAMVLHQRRQRIVRGALCDGDCPHDEAKALWSEALGVYGERAYELPVSSHSRHRLTPRGEPSRRRGAAMMRASTGRYAGRAISNRVGGGRMRTASVTYAVVLAFAMGAAAALFESRLLIATVTIGMVPLIWGASHVIERLTGRELWRFSAPYPYGGIHESDGVAIPSPAPAVEHRHPDSAGRDSSSARWAA